MGVTPCSVHDQGARVLSDSLCKCLGTLLYNNVSPPDFTRHAAVQGWACLWVLTILEGRNDDFSLNTWFTLPETSDPQPQNQKFEDLEFTICPLMELPLTARSPRYAKSFCARFCVCTSLNRSGVSSINYKGRVS